MLVSLRKQQNCRSPWWADRLTDSPFSATYRSPYICMSADPRSSKHYKSCRYEIKSTQPGSQIYVTIDRYLLAIIIFKWKKPKQSSYQFEKREQNVIAMHAGKGLYTSCAGKHGGRYKTNFITLKPVLAFQTLTLATLGKWATTHQRYFLGQELLLDFAAWLDLTSNADNTITV